MRFPRWILGVALLAVAVPAYAQVKVVGDWHAVRPGSATNASEEKGRRSGERRSKSGRTAA